MEVHLGSLMKRLCAWTQWEPQHQDLSCEQFQQWKRDNDPEYQKQGLAGYLRDNGISEAHHKVYPQPQVSFHFPLTAPPLFILYQPALLYTVSCSNAITDTLIQWLKTHFLWMFLSCFFICLTFLSKHTLIQYNN